MNRASAVDIRIERIDDGVSLTSRRIGGPFLMIWGTVGALATMRGMDPFAAGSDVAMTALLILKEAAIALAGWSMLRTRTFQLPFVLLLAAGAIILLAGCGLGK